MQFALREGATDVECRYSAPANREATLCVSSSGADAKGCCCEVMFMTQQGSLIFSVPEPDNLAVMLPGLDVTGASIRKRCL